MQTITTATGTTHEVRWCGVSSLSFTLFIEFEDKRRAADIIAEFDNPDAIGDIAFFDGINTTHYLGYKALIGFGRISEGNVRIELTK